jgi:hypothetical protein
MVIPHGASAYAARASNAGRLQYRDARGTLQILLVFFGGGVGTLARRHIATAGRGNRLEFAPSLGRKTVMPLLS